MNANQSQSQKSMISAGSQMRSASTEPGPQPGLVVGRIIHKAAITAITINASRTIMTSV